MASSLPSWPTTQSRAECALVSVSRVPNVLDEMMNRVSCGVEVAGGLHEVRRIHIGHEPERQVAAGVVPQRLVGHHRAEVGAADADIDHVPDRFTGIALPVAGADPLGEGGHPVQDLVHLRDHVGPVDHQRAAPGHPQRDMQHGPVLGDVDRLAAEHGVPALLQAGLLGQLQEQPDGFAGDPVLGVVQVQPGGLRGEALAAAGVGGEQVPQVPVADLVVVGFQRLPCRALAKGSSRHLLSPPGGQRWAGTGSPGST